MKSVLEADQEEEEMKNLGSMGAKIDTKVKAEEDTFQALNLVPPTKQQNAFLKSNFGLSRFVNRDHGTVGMSDKSSEVTSVSVRISSSVSVSKDTLHIDNTSGVSVSKLGSSNSRCVSRDYSAIVVSHKLGTGYSHQGRENQELHIGMCVLR